MAGLFHGLVPEDSYSGMLPGVTTGTVKENWDAGHKGMVKVEMILGEDGKNLTGWVPVMSPYAGKEYGQYALPEIGTEVVIAFNMGNRNCPIVIGCLWNNNNTLQAEVPQEKNTIKQFKTKGGNFVTISDEEGKESITVSTKAGFQMQFLDEKKTISISDMEAKNVISLNAETGEIVFNAEKKMSFQLGGTDVLVMDGNSRQVTLTSGKINVKADQALDMQGQNTTLKGTMMNITGDSSFKAECSAMLQVKGAMVKIN